MDRTHRRVGWREAESSLVARRTKKGTDARPDHDYVRITSGIEASPSNAVASPLRQLPSRRHGRVFCLPMVAVSSPGAGPTKRLLRHTECGVLFRGHSSRLSSRGRSRLLAIADRRAERNDGLQFGPLAGARTAQGGSNALLCRQSGRGNGHRECRVDGRVARNPPEARSGSLRSELGGDLPCLGRLLLERAVGRCPRSRDGAGLRDERSPVARNARFSPASAHPGSLRDEAAAVARTDRGKSVRERLLGTAWLVHRVPCPNVEPNRLGAPGRDGGLDHPGRGLLRCGRGRRGAD